MKKSRRNILKAGLATIAAVVTGKSVAAESDTVRVLTKDGKVLDIPRRKIRKKGKADTSDVQNWINQKDHVR